MAELVPVQITSLSASENPPYSAPEAWKKSLLAVAPAGDFVFVAVHDKIHIFETRADGSLGKRLPVSSELTLDSVNVLAIVGKYLVVGDMAGQLTFFSTEDATHRLTASAQLDVDDPSIWSISGTSAGNEVFIGSNKREINKFRIVENSDGNLRLEQQNLHCSHSHNIPSVAASPNDRFIASASIDQSMRVFDLASGEEVRYWRCDEWGWAVQWFHRSFIKVIHRNVSTERERPENFASIRVETPENMGRSIHVGMPEVQTLVPEDASAERPEDVPSVHYVDEGSAPASLHRYLQLLVQEFPEEASRSPESDAIENAEALVRDECSDSLQDEFVIFCSAYDVYLLDVSPSKVQVLSRIVGVADDTKLPNIFESHRVIFLETIPELSAFLVASSGGSQVVVIRIAQLEDQYCLIKEQRFPSTPQTTPLRGISVTRPVEVDFEEWRVYTLWADGSVRCHSLRRGNFDLPLQISGIL